MSARMCFSVPDRRAAANFVCADFCRDGDDPRPVYHDMDDDVFIPV